MERRATKKEYPWWVKLSMMGVPGRAGLWACVAVSLLLAAGGLYFWQSDARARPFTLFAIAALPYWLSIRWVDRHGAWDSGADMEERP